MGRPKTVSDGEVLRAIREVEGPACTAPEIADHLGEERRTIQRRMNELVENGRLNRKKVGKKNQTVIYWKIFLWM